MRLVRAFVVLASLAAAVFALAGCGLNPSGNGTGTTLRVANLIPGSTSVTVTAGGTAFMSGSPFETITSYADIPAGPYTFSVNLAGATTPAFSIVNTLFNVSAYTFVTYGQTTTVGGLLLADTLLQNVPTGNFALRLANVSPTAGAVDAYLTAPGADLAAVSPIVAGIVYQSNSAFINVPLGTYQLRLTRTGTKEVIFDAPAPAFADGSGQTVVAYSRGSARLVNVVLLTSAGASTIINNQLAQIKAVNASSVASPLNVFVDGALTLANIPYTGVSNYQRVAAGARTITVEAAATPGATLLTTTPTLKAATDTSIALYGAAGSLGALFLTDANVSTIVGRAQVRIVNVSPDLPALDIYANQALAAAGVLQNSASAYVPLDADAVGTAYQIDFDLAGTTTTVLTLPAVTLTVGSIYTIYVMGPATALQGIVVQDF
ncbi:MAG: DUF4397 domain-containing protein [Casimicrobiaceae bacterium]